MTPSGYYRAVHGRHLIGTTPRWTQSRLQPVHHRLRRRIRPHPAPRRCSRDPRTSGQSNHR